MSINDAFEFLNFWINKRTGSFYTVSELELLIDRGQMAYYSDIKPKYATSQLVKDTLAPFRYVYPFTNMSGYIIAMTPEFQDDTRPYLDLLDLQITFQVSDRTVYYSVPIVNEDVISQKLNSQVDPVTITSPIGEQIAIGTFRLYPASFYTGSVTFLRRPRRPVFGYSVISERVIVYNPITSVQLEWRDTEQNAILLKALSSIGINLTSQEVSQFAELKTQENYQNVNRL